MTYQSPSLVILAEGNIFFNAAGTFPEKDGSTGKSRASPYGELLRDCDQISMKKD